MDATTYGNNGYSLTERKTDMAAAKQLLDKAYRLVSYVSQRYHDKEVVIDIHDVIAAFRQKDPVVFSKQLAKMEDIARGLAAISRHRIERFSQSMIAEEGDMAYAEKRPRMLERKNKASRTMRTLLLLTSVLEMRKKIISGDFDESSRIFLNEIFIRAPATLMGLEEGDIDYQNEELMNEYRSLVMEVISQQTWESLERSFELRIKSS